MTVEQIEKKIIELSEMKKNKLKQEKARVLKQEKAENEKKRKLENRVKYILGGYVLINKKEVVQEVISSTLRESDRKALTEYFEDKKDYFKKQVTK